MISVTRDKNGTIVDGNPDKVADITDGHSPATPRLAIRTGSWLAREARAKAHSLAGLELARLAIGVTGLALSIRCLGRVCRPPFARELACLSRSPAPPPRQLPYPERELPFSDHRRSIRAGGMVRYRGLERGRPSRRLQGVPRQLQAHFRAAKATRRAEGARYVAARSLPGCQGRRTGRWHQGKGVFRGALYSGPDFASGRGGGLRHRLLRARDRRLTDADRRL